MTTSLRDQFAMAALTGLLSGRSSIVYAEDSVKKAYTIADAMLEEKARTDKKSIPPNIQPVTEMRDGYIYLDQLNGDYYKKEKDKVYKLVQRTGIWVDHPYKPPMRLKQVS